MKKPLAICALALLAVALYAQDAPGAPAGAGIAGGVSMLDVNRYVSYFPIKKIDDNDYVWSATGEDYERFMTLKGGKDDWAIDTPLEFALLSYYSPPVINIRPVQAAEILPANDPRTAGLKLGAAVLKELTELRFLDPRNAAAIARYEGMLQFISDKNGVSRAEIDGFFREGIATLTLEKFNEISFGLEHNSKYYNVTLSRNPSTKEFILSYDRGDKTISGANWDTFLAAMNRNREFGAQDVEQVKIMAGLIPAVVYADWLGNGVAHGVDAVRLAANTIADYYLHPTQNNYNLLVGIFGLFDDRGEFEDLVAKAGHDAYRNTIYALNEQLGEKAGIESLSKGAALARAARAYNSAYGVFAIPYRGAQR